ncbi:hypothetical protein KR054_004428, partial [Drosophila jambulina]
PSGSLLPSCLVVIVGSLAWTARAMPSQGDQTFNSELTRLKNVYGSDSVNQYDKYRNIPELMNFYEKYGNQLQLTPEERRQGDNALRQYKEEQAKQPLVEGVPAQGFWWLVIPVAVDVVTTLIKKAVGV